MTLAGRFASVGLNMVVIQHALTRRYLQSFAEWSAELDEAWEFASAAEAVQYCEWRGLTDVQIVVAGADEVHHLPLRSEERRVGKEC